MTAGDTFLTGSPKCKSGLRKIIRKVGPDSEVFERTGQSHPRTLPKMIFGRVFLLFWHSGPRFRQLVLCAPTGPKKEARHGGGGTVVMSLHELTADARER
jgi:hypothetical protein